MKLSLLEFCFECKARCCFIPPIVVLPEEKERIEKATGMKVFEREKDYFILSQEPCPFLRGFVCSIEDIKPINCRIYPMVLTWETAGGLKPKWIISDDCPCSKKIDKDFIREAEKIGRRLVEYVYKSSLTEKA